MPQRLQNQTEKRFASGRSNRVISVSPVNHFIWLCGTKMFEACALPLAFWHRLQWQYLKPDRGGLISNFTDPHMQLPVNASGCIPTPFGRTNCPPTLAEFGRRLSACPRPPAVTQLLPFANIRLTCEVNVIMHPRKSRAFSRSQVIAARLVRECLQLVE